MSRLFRRCALAIQARFNAFDPAIARYDATRVDGDDAPIFIVGTPRSGSTLLYQVMLQQFRLAYISNLMALVPRHMVKLGRWFPSLVFGYSGRLHRGDLGFVPGLAGPSETGKVMDAWFAGDAGTAEREQIRRTIAAISAIAGAPVLIKSLSLFSKLAEVQAIFPSCRFVHLRREPLFVAQSILLNRRESRHPAEQWRGVEPEGYAGLAQASEEYRAVWQVLTIAQEVSVGLRAAGDRVTVLDYGEFCARPRQALARIGGQLSLATRDDAPALPEAFPQADRVRVDAATWAALEAAYQDIAGARDQL